MELVTYERVVDSINEKQFDHDKTLRELVVEFPDERVETLRSIVSQEYQRQVKSRFRHLHHADTRKSVLSEFCRRVREGDRPAIIVDIAKRHQTSAAITAKIVLEEYLDLGEDKEAVKRQVGRYMRDTNLLEDRDLAYEVFLASLKDDSYGPLAESIKHSIGEEHEQKIKDRLRALDIPFVDEHVLRSKGYDKTPDVKLEVPIAVGGRVINWIESKALFGDREAHEGYLRDQFWSYWNRFGPGLVIYWFGYIKQLDNNGEAGISLTDRFPENITRFRPEGLGGGGTTEK